MCKKNLQRNAPPYVIICGETHFFVLTIWRKIVSDGVVLVDYEAQSNQILRALGQGPLSMNELVNTLGLKSKTGALKRTVGELLAQKLLVYTIPDKPNSRLQKYRLTETGLNLMIKQMKEADAGEK